MSYGKPYATQDCPIVYNTIHPSQCNSHNNLSPEDILNKYVPQGFSNFKLEGRTLGMFENMANLVRYMVKPEYQGKGIGSNILKDIIEKNKERHIKIQYFKQNSVGKLYQRLGFILVGETKYHYQMEKIKTK